MTGWLLLQRSYSTLHMDNQLTAEVQLEVFAMEL
jgi:hypothetical protein